MDFDIAIYAVIAIVLLARLWSIFGRRNDSDPQRPNPFIMPAPGSQDDKQNSSTVAAPTRDPETPALPRALIGAAPTSLAGGLAQIKALDPSFDEKTFLQGARTAFTMIVEDFAKDDMTRIGRLLGPNVLPHFQNAIDARKKAGQSMESRVTLIRDADVTAARVDDNKRAILTVRYVSEQQNTLRDAGGQAIHGADGATEEITDMWTFARDTKSADPNWILLETHS